MKRYLYFGEATVETTGEAATFSVDSFLGMTPAGAATTDMKFKSRNGAFTDDSVRVVHTGHTTKAFMTEIVKFMQANQKNPFLIIADRTNPTAVTSMIASLSVATEA
tara:strand:- start:571 stop:891 length:321 start_codon:yes stop_codon:yes gene_type:complete